MIKNYQNDVLEVYGYLWNRVFADQNFVLAVSAATGLLQEQSAMDMAATRTLVSRLGIPSLRTQNWRTITLSEDDLERRLLTFGDSILYGEAHVFGEASSPKKFVFPWNPLFKPYFLTDGVEKASVVLTAEKDFSIIDDFIYFNSNPMDIFQSTIGEVDDVPCRMLKLYAFRMKVEEYWLRDHFGSYAGVSATNYSKLVSLINAVWDLRVEGASVINIGKLLAAVTDSGLFLTDGIVREIWTENSRLYIATDIEIADAPAGSSAVVAVGDAVIAGQSPFNLFRVYTGADDIPFAEFPALCAGPGLTDGNYKSSLVFENVATDLTFGYETGQAGVYLLMDNTGALLVDPTSGNGSLLVDDQGDLAALTGAAKIPLFRVGGRPEDLERFRHRLAQGMWKHDAPLFDVLTAGQSIPYHINPFEFIKDDALRRNALFISLSAASIVSGLEPVFTFLKNSIPAGTMYFLHTAFTPTAETYACADIEEEIGTFLAVGTEEEYINTSIEELPFANTRVG